MVKVMGPALELAYAPLLRKRRKKTIEAVHTPPTYVKHVTKVDPITFDWQFDHQVTLTDSDLPELALDYNDSATGTQQTPTKIRCEYLYVHDVGSSWSIDATPANLHPEYPPIAIPQSGTVQ